MDQTPVDESLPRLPTREEMAELLKRPLDDTLEYFDATPSIEKLAEAYRILGERVVLMERLLQLQSTINSRLITNMNQLLFQMTELQKPKSSIIMPDSVN